MTEVQERCSRCGGENGRRHYWCANCFAEWMRDYRADPEQARRNRARATASRALLRGAIKREGCEVCGEPAEMHHDDYARPLEVRWRCRAHHLELHCEERAMTASAAAA